MIFPLATAELEWTLTLPEGNISRRLRTVIAIMTAKKPNATPAQSTMATVVANRTTTIRVQAIKAVAISAPIVLSGRLGAPSVRLLPVACLTIAI